MSGLSCDVLVIGSGAGGASAAYVLAKRGAEVLVVEKGKYHSREDFCRDELKICRRDFFVPYVSDEPILMRHRHDQPFRAGNSGWTACGVGGGTVHMSGFFYRLHEQDFKLRSFLGEVEGATHRDWPITYQDLEPYYNQAEYLLGVSGQAGENPFDMPRNKPYPLPPLLEHPAAGRLDEVSKKLGWHPFATPRAVLSQAYDARPHCSYSGLCGSYGCETGAKSSALASLWPKALATGRCRIIAEQMAAEILVDKAGRASGAVIVDQQGQRQTIKARVVCVAAGAIQSARLLLNSRSTKFPKGLANNNDQVGRNLVFNGFSHVEAEFLRAGAGKSLPDFDNSLPWLGRSVQDFYTYEMQGTARKGGTLRFDFVHPNPIYNAEQVALHHGPALWGQPLKEALRRRFRLGRTMEAEIFGEFLSSPGCRVEVDDKLRDRFGVLVPKVSVLPLQRNIETSTFLAERAVDLFTAMGADRVDIRTKGSLTYVLQGGTCVMGNQAETSVLDKTGRAHEVDNLYVVDGSALPSTGGIPITLTIHANALRMADGLARRFEIGTL